MNHWKNLENKSQMDNSNYGQLENMDWTLDWTLARTLLMGVNI